MAAFFAVLAALLWGGYWVIFGHDAKRAEVTAQYATYAGNMIVLHTAAIDFLRANLSSIGPGTVMTAQIGAINPAPRINPDPGFVLPPWFIPAGAWRVVWGDNPADPTAFLVATYWPPVTAASDWQPDPVKLALGLGEITGGSIQAGIVANGRVSSPGASPTIPSSPVPVDAAGVSLVPEGSAILVSGDQKPQGQ